MSSNSVIQSLWIGPALSTVEKLTINSFLANGHDFHLYAYSDIEGVPAGTTIRDANEILPESSIFTYQCEYAKGSYAAFANYFRYSLLLRRGGWWVDTDVVCLRPFDFPDEVVVAQSFEGKWGVLPINCVIKPPPGDRLMEWAAEKCESVKVDELKYGETGPLLIQRGVKELGYADRCADFDVFCPFTWRQLREGLVYQDSTFATPALNELKELYRRLFRPLAIRGRITRNTVAVHLWNEVWRQNGLDKNARYHPSCFFEQAKRRFL